MNRECRIAHKQLITNNLPLSMPGLPKKKENQHTDAPAQNSYTGGQFCRDDERSITHVGVQPSGQRLLTDTPACHRGFLFINL